MRQRIEDLGRILSLLDNTLELQCFSLNERYGAHRSKDLPDIYKAMSSDQQEDLLWDLICGYSLIKDRLYDILEIAKGEDYLNLPECDL